ncbi:cell wall hydrolase [Sphingomonas sp. ID0503]|uniref:cell wall hydrolase n=1 Tax=Sphingomonas sp. ID0503 TaxID=3399691 RepID=UPI003AFADA58
MSLDLRAALFAVASFCVLGLGTVSAPSVAGNFVPAVLTSPSVSTDFSANNDQVPLEVPAVAGDPAIGEMPTVKAATLAGLVEQRADHEADDRDEACLASTIYYEAKSESLEGQLAVAEVVINRSKSGKFPAGICSVITQPSQFGFVRAGRYNTPPQSSAAWKKAVAIARIAMDGEWQSEASDSLYFHAARVRPSWPGAKRVAQIGAHIFYR